MRARAAPATLQGYFQFDYRKRAVLPAPQPATGATGPAAGSRSDRERRHGREPGNVRVLVCFEDRYRAYREVIAEAIQSLRPRAEVAIVTPGALEAEVARLRPHLVISNRRDLPGRDLPLAWLELPHEPERPATVLVEGRAPEATTPTLDGLLSVVDAVEKLAGTAWDTQVY